MMRLVWLKMLRKEGGDYDGGGGYDDNGDCSGEQRLYWPKYKSLVVRELTVANLVAKAQA